MLDDLKLIHVKDKFDALGLAEKQWQQLQHSYSIQIPQGDYRNVVLAGMGGSALAAEFSTQWPGWKVPFNISRSSEIPPHVNESTLFIASSYSGNTEETVAALAKAEEAGATIVVMASGGKLVEIARAKQYPLAELPAIQRPRYGAMYGFKALVSIGEAAGLLAQEGCAQMVTQAATGLQVASASWTPQVAVDQNLAKQVALELMGRTVVVYASPRLYPAAYKWKISMNENAKNTSWSGMFSEFNHNEFVGWTSHPIEKPFAIVYLLSSLDDDRLRKRFALSEKLLSGRWPAPIHIDIQGSTLLEQMLWAVTLGDFVSIYLALLNGVDPIEGDDKDIIEVFKKQLG